MCREIKVKNTRVEIISAPNIFRLEEKINGALRDKKENCKLIEIRVDTATGSEIALIATIVYEVKEE